MSSLRIENHDPFAVCITLEGCHGLEGVKEESWEELGPKAAKVVKGSQDGPCTWWDVVVVAGKVPDESQEICHRGRVVRSSAAPLNPFPEHRVKLVVPGDSNHFVVVNLHRLPVAPLLQLENITHGDDKVEHLLL